MTSSVAFATVRAKALFGVRCAARRGAHAK
jgi:hypothetical protein